MSIKMIVFIVLGLGFLYGLFTVGLPFLLAMVTAIFLENIIVFVMKVFRMNRFAAASVVCTVYTILLLGMFYLLGLKIVTEIVAFWNVAPAYMEEASAFIADTLAQTKLLYESLSPDTAAQIESSLKSGITALTDALKGVVAEVSRHFLNVAKGIPIMLIFFIVYLVATYLFCFSLSRIKQSFLHLFEEKSRGKVDDVLNNLRNSIFGFLRAQIFISGLTYIVTLFGLLILGVDYPLAIALLIIVVDILPILGTGSVLVPWAVYNLAIHDMYLGVGLLILFLFITIFRRIVEPKVLGDSVGISALSALASLYVGFQLVGIVGLFLGPIIVIIYHAMRKVGLLQIKIKLE